MKYASLFSAALFTSIVLSPSAQAQERAASPLLPKIFATFRAADLNRDGDLAQDERDAVGLPKEDGKAFDLDSDGLWCEGEFVLYYRRLLKRNGKKIDRALEMEAGRINRAYKDAADRGLNRDAAKRAADAVRAGTLEAAQEAATPDNDAGEASVLPEVQIEPAPTVMPNEAEPANEPFLPERVEIEPEPAETTPEGVDGFEQPLAVPPPFELPTWAPAPENEGVENVEPTEVQEEPDSFLSEPEAIPALDEGSAFVVPEFTRPDPVSPPAFEEEGLEPAPEALEDPEVEPTPEETPPLEIEFAPVSEPSIPSPTSESTSYDVFGEPTVDIPEEENEVPVADSESATEQELDSPPTQVDAPAAPIEPEESKPAAVDRPLTDRELDELRQEEDAKAARERYAFPEPEATQEEETLAGDPKEVAPANEIAQPVKADSEPSAKLENSPDSSTAKKSVDSVAPQGSGTKIPAEEKDLNPKPEKPLSLWERADRARKLRAQREKEAQEAQEKPAETPAEKPTEKPAAKPGEKPSETPSADAEEADSEGPF